MTPHGGAAGDTSSATAAPCRHLIRLADARHLPLKGKALGGTPHGGAAGGHLMAALRATFPSRGRLDEGHLIRLPFGQTPSPKGEGFG